MLNLVENVIYWGCLLFLLAFAARDRQDRACEPARATILLDGTGFHDTLVPRQATSGTSPNVIQTPSRTKGVSSRAVTSSMCSHGSDVGL